MSGYTKLFSSLLTSSVWSEPDHVRVVWITLLALSDSSGAVEAALPGIARIANVSLDAAGDAIRRLEEPDEHSRSPEHDGRRIERTDGGWQILNYVAYRSKLTADDRREYERQRKAEYRSSRNNLTRMSRNVPKCPDYTEAEAEAEAEASKTSPSRVSIPSESHPSTEPDAAEAASARAARQERNRELSARYSPADLATIREGFDRVDAARKSGRAAFSVKLAALEYFARFDVADVIEGTERFLERDGVAGQPEAYWRGCVRGAKRDREGAKDAR